MEKTAFIISKLLGSICSEVSVKRNSTKSDGERMIIDAKTSTNCERGYENVSVKVDKHCTIRIMSYNVGVKYDENSQPHLQMYHLRMINPKQVITTIKSLRRTMGFISEKSKC